MKTNRLFALGLMMALAGGACGDDSGGGGKTNPDGGPGPINPDGGPGPGVLPDGGPGPGVLPDGGPGPVDDGGGMVVTPGGATSKTITAAGGSISSADGKLTVTFSRYALGRPTKVEIKPITPAPEGAIGTAYEITPAQEPLLTDKNAFTTVTLKYTEADLGGGSPQDTKIGRYVSGRWIELTSNDRVKSKANPSAMSVTAPVTALGQVALLGGFCVTCPEPACTMGAACQVGMPAVAGKCVATGNGCNVCRPVCDGDNDGFCTQGQFGTDCNDSNPKVRPNGGENNGAGVPTGDWPELCNGIDDNCQNGVDEGCKTCKTTADCGDSFFTCEAGLCVACGSGCQPGDACTQGPVGNTIPGRCAPYGVNNTCSQCRPACDTDGDGQCATADDVHFIQGGDCDETDPNVRQGANEVCGNGKDDDCNGSIDDNCGSCTTDADCTVAGTICTAGACVACASTSCDAATCVVNGAAGRCATSGNGCNTCVALCDGDADGLCANNGDCNDSNRQIRQGAPEICGNGVDENCDGHFDEGCKACAADADCTVGNEACVKGACNTCGACDTNCRWPRFVPDGTPTIAGSCFAYGTGCGKCVPPGDVDGDGWVTPTVAAAALAGTPSVQLRSGDCDDTLASVHPNTELTGDDTVALELCDNMKDDDCDGKTDEDCDTCASAMMCGAPGTCSNNR
jgi:hypothetical protein